MGPQTSSLAWRIPTQINGGGSAIGRDGTIYQGTDFGEFLAPQPRWHDEWTVLLPYRVNATPAILLDGRIAFVDEGGSLYVVNPEGSFSWRYDTGTVYPSPSSAPAIGRNGTIYTFIADTVYAFRPNGTLRWSYDTGGNTSPAQLRLERAAWFMFQAAICSRSIRTGR